MKLFAALALVTTVSAQAATYGRVTNINVNSPTGTIVTASIWWEGGRTATLNIDTADAMQDRMLGLCLDLAKQSMATGTPFAAYDPFGSVGPNTPEQPNAYLTGSRVSCTLRANP